MIQLKSLERAGNPYKSVQSHTEASRCHETESRCFQRLEVCSFTFWQCVGGRTYLHSTPAQHSALLWLPTTFPGPAANKCQQPESSSSPVIFHFYLLQQAQSKQPFVAKTTGVNSLSSGYSEVHLLLTYLFAVPALLSVYLSLPPNGCGAQAQQSLSARWADDYILSYLGESQSWFFNQHFTIPVLERQSFYSSRLFSGCFKGLFIWRGSCLAGDERCFYGQCWQRAGGCEKGSKEERMESLEEAMLSGFLNPA